MVHSIFKAILAIYDVRYVVFLKFNKEYWVHVLSTVLVTATVWKRTIFFISWKLNSSLRS